MLKTEKDAAEAIGVTVQTLRQWRCKKVGPPAHKLPTGGIRYDVDEVVKWAKSNKETPGAEFC